MFRLKIALVFVVFVTALVGASYALVQSQVAPTLTDDAEVSLRRAAVIAEKSARLDDFALLEKAQFVARRSDLHAAMLDEYEATGI